MPSLLALAVGARDKSVPPHSVPRSVPRLAGVLRDIKHPVPLIYGEDGGPGTSEEDTLTDIEFVIKTALK